MIDCQLQTICGESSKRFIYPHKSSIWYLSVPFKKELYCYFTNNKFFNMDNLVSYEILQAVQIIGVFVGLYSIILGLLLEIDRPKLKKQK